MNSPRALSSFLVSTDLLRFASPVRHIFTDPLLLCRLSLRICQPLLTQMNSRSRLLTGLSLTPLL